MSTSRTIQEFFIRNVRALQKQAITHILLSAAKAAKKNGVHIVGTGEQSKSRIKRMRLDTKKVYEAALSVDADIYHIHDPELLPYALKLKKGQKGYL